MKIFFILAGTLLLASCDCTPKQFKEIGITREQAKDQCKVRCLPNSYFASDVIGGQLKCKCSDNIGVWK